MENTSFEVSNKDNRVNIQYNVNGTVNVYINQPSASNTAAQVVFHSTEKDNSAESSGASLGLVKAVQQWGSNAVEQLATRAYMNQPSAGNTAAPVVLHSTEGGNSAGANGASLGPVTVQRLATDVVTCARCRADVTVFRYRDAAGWRCQHCAPAKHACRYQPQGCSFIDIQKKCLKHEWYYCQLRPWCYIMRRAGSTWRAMQTGFWTCYCLVSSVAGTAVCWYMLDDTQFELSVCTPLESERLHEFRCVITLMHLTTGHAHTYTPDVPYDECYDWYICVKKAEFPSWSCEFNVSIDINKID